MKAANKKLEYHKKCFQDTISYLQIELDVSKGTIQKGLDEKAELLDHI